MTPRDTLLLEMAKRYEWLCQVGWSQPVLNDPRVIHGEATAKDIDYLIADGMKRWPLRAAPTPLSAA